MEVVYGGNTVLSHPIFVETILPFILVFTIVFGVLQKSQLFGEKKKQIDSLVAAVIGLLAISFGQAIGIILQLTVFLSVGLVVVLVMMLLLGSFGAEGKMFGDEGTFPKWLKRVSVIAVVLAVVIAVTYITGFWTYLYDWIYIGTDSSVFINVLFFVIIGGAIAAVILGSKDDGGKDK